LTAIQPSSHFYEASGLRLHYLLWGDESKPPLFFVHGGRDHAHMWDGIAEAFAATHAVYVPDLRGHGDSDWSSASQYAIPDFVADLTVLIEKVRLPRGEQQTVTLVGHSRGGGIILRYAGTFPERVSRAVSIDGIGRHTRWEVPAPRRLRAWIERRLEADTWETRVYPSIEAAVEPAMRNNPRLNREQALDLARSGTRPVDGGVSWKFDPRVRFHPAYDFGDDELKSFFAAIQAPVLLIRGDESHLGERDLGDWAKEFANARAEIVPGAGHWVQHERPDEVIGLLRSFLGEPATVA
jgi:pimeloyl-ACP methyl ester carboxylesterase